MFTAARIIPAVNTAGRSPYDWLQLANAFDDQAAKHPGTEKGRFAAGIAATIWTDKLGARTDADA